MIAVIDYGTGNLGSVSKALESLGGNVKVTQKASDLERAEKIVLPGVGAFRDAMNALTSLNLIDSLKHQLASKKIYLGICLGLELLFDKSEEGGSCKGLGILRGDVVRFSSFPTYQSASCEKGGFASGKEEKRLKVPHMGWNQLDVKNENCPLFRGIKNGTFFYFVHSYYARPADTKIIAACTDYGGKFASMIWKDNIYAVQYHPEKSQEAGLKFLRNFLKL